jgi:hypothetical protein
MKHVILPQSSQASETSHAGACPVRFAMSVREDSQHQRAG